jgi:hypothetical protein
MSFLQVASWNIEHLSGAGKREKIQSAFALADHIEMAGVDIVALQEIYVTRADEDVRINEGGPLIEPAFEGERRNRELDIVCYLLQEHLGGEWAYRILPNRAAGDTSQLCAVLWSKRKVTLAAVEKLAVEHTFDGLKLWDRAPHAVKFTSKVKVWRKDASGQWRQSEVDKSIAVIPLHMKSNYGGVTENRRIRAAEAVTLCAQLDWVRANIDPSLILIGDTNILKNDEPAIETFVSNGLIDLNNNDSPTYWSRDYGDSPFDRALIATNREEFKYSRQYVLRSSDLVAHDRFLSDHFMIKMSVKAYLDEDDVRPGLI